MCARMWMMEAMLAQQQAAATSTECGYVLSFRFCFSPFFFAGVMFSAGCTFCLGFGLGGSLLLKCGGLYENEGGEVRSLTAHAREETGWLVLTERIRTRRGCQTSLLSDPSQFVRGGSFDRL